MQIFHCTVPLDDIHGRKDRDCCLLLFGKIAASLNIVGINFLSFENKTIKEYLKNILVFGLFFTIFLQTSSH